MADLGTITVTDPIRVAPTLHPLSAYTVHRGMHIGAIPALALPRLSPVLHSVSDYIVRQIRIIYRQLWPTHGQRFPQ
jgi:hypothetical protein